MWRAILKSVRDPTMSAGNVIAEVFLHFRFSATDNPYSGMKGV